MLEGAVISKERLMQDYTDFLGKTILTEYRNVAVLLHTGSVCFDAISLIFAAVSNWTHNTMKGNVKISRFCWNADITNTD